MKPSNFPPRSVDCIVGPGGKVSLYSSGYRPLLVTVSSFGSGSVDFLWDSGSGANPAQLYNISTGGSSTIGGPNSSYVNWPSVPYTPGVLIVQGDPNMVGSCYVSI